MESLVFLELLETLQEFMCFITNQLEWQVYKFLNYKHAKKMFKGKVFYRLMLSLACCDLLYVATSLAIFSAPQLWPHYTGYIYDKLPNIMSKAPGLSVLGIYILSFLDVRVL